MQISKHSIYTLDNTISVKSVKVDVGHLKPNSAYPEHGLLLTELAGQAPCAHLVKHGKRLRNTIILNSTVSSSRK